MSGKEINPGILIIGATGIAKVALDIFKSNGRVVMGFLDDDKKNHDKTIDDVPVLGSTEDEEYLKMLSNQQAEVFVATDDNKLRKKITEMLVEDYKSMPVNAIHQNAYIEKNAAIGHGNLIQNGAVIQSFAEIKNHCIIGVNAVVDYETVISDYVQIGSGAIIGSGVKIAQGVFIGSGAVVVSGLSIGKNARIGAGSVVIADVKDNATVFGNPAESV